VPAVRRAAFEPIIDKLCGSKWGTESFDIEFERALFAENQSPRPKSVVAVTGAEGYGLLFTSFYADVRLSAAIVAAHSRDRGAVEHLLKALGDADASVRSSAAAALGAVADKKTLPPLINALCAERNPFVRRSIVSALGNFKEEDAVVLLLDSLRDENAVVRASACRSLERNAAREDSATIFPLLKDRDECVRRAAAVAIMKIDPAMEGWGAAYVAAEFLDNVNPEVRDEALNALKGFSRQDFGVDKKKWLDWLDKNRPRAGR
jgi:vesicle coat complex subunit